MNSEQNTGAVRRILYSDNEIAVVLKLPGEICEKSAEHPDTSLLHLSESAISGILGHSPECLEAVHRLDQPVSGCVVLALTQEALASLSAEFRKNSSVPAVTGAEKTAAGDGGRAVRKTYWAVVEGVIPRSENYTELNHLISFDGGRKKAFVRSIDSSLAGNTSATAPASGEAKKTPGGWKPARLLWRSLGCGDRYSFIEIIPETGRTHQIRAQLAAVDLRIKGDVKYGARRSDTLPGIRLHGRSISFMHPSLKRVIQVTAPLPQTDALWDAFLAAAGTENIVQEKEKNVT